MIIEYYEKIKELLKPYYLWLLVPLLILYGLDFLQLLVTLAFTISYVILLCIILSFVGGVTLGILAHLPNHDYSNIFKMRVTKMLPPVRWGHDVVYWMLEVEDDSTQA